MDPLLLDVPTEITTARLRLRVPRAGDGAVVTPTVRAALPELKRWMPWATDAYDAAAGEVWCRRSAGLFLLRQEVPFLIFDRDGGHLGTAGLFAFRWDVTECEVGYWLGTPHVGHGYMTEVVAALVALAADPLKVGRVVLRVDPANVRSRRVAERCGFALDPDLSTAAECVYARAAG